MGLSLPHGRVPRHSPRVGSHPRWFSPVPVTLGWEEQCNPGGIPRNEPRRL